MITQRVEFDDVGQFLGRPLECIGGPLDGDTAAVFGSPFANGKMGWGGWYVLSMIRDSRYGLPSVALVWSPDA